MTKIRYPDSMVFSPDGKTHENPDFRKIFILKGIGGKDVQHECLYEGVEGYKMLDNHVIFAQITERGIRTKGDTYKNIENTPIAAINSLPPRPAISNDTKVWRYLPRFKFEDLINSEQLYYARIDQFEDKLEGTAPCCSIRNILMDTHKNHEQKKEAFRLYKLRMESNRKVAFVSCWHINNNINPAMWNSYGAASTESVVIQTDLQSFNGVLDKVGLPFLNEPVRYFDEPYFNQNVYWFPSLFKRLKYAPEQELRSIFFMYGNEATAFRLKVRLEALIHNVYVHPDATKEYYNYVSEFLRSKGLNIPIK